MGAALFIAEPTGTCRLFLRRFRFSKEGDDHLHDASVCVDENALITPPNHDGTSPVSAHRIPHNDLRWPTVCVCGESFRDDDEWQVNELDWYEGNGHRFVFGIGHWDGPPGAMWRTIWRDVDGRPPAYHVVLPNGTTWNTNDRASGDGSKFGDYWTITGMPPTITVNPSIDDRGSRPWHGHITSGVFVP
jgi:hypothetical protein